MLLRNVLRNVFLNHKKRGCKSAPFFIQTLFFVLFALFFAK